ELGKKILNFCEPNNLFEKIPKERLQDYLELFKIKALRDLLEDEETMNTVRLFFKNNLNISAASKDSFMHRNTLIYRIEKIKKAVGLNIKNFEEARILKNLILIKGFLDKEDML
ncbi:MAG: helix-turn-helix domain-containing protein, partial [Clostridia bacterium]|nr:helix-turn-helix domain-containing protein [Clostridia bacterium]